MAVEGIPYKGIGGWLLIWLQHGLL